jgi:hypothetical protein
MTLRVIRAVLRAAALAAVCGASGARAQSVDGFDLLSPDTLTAAADIRLVAADGEESWTSGGFGKLRFDGDRDRDWRVTPVPAAAALIWQPRLGWTLSGTVVGLIQDVGGNPQTGLSEAYLSWKPMASGKLRLAARVGLMWPPLSLEHSGPEWAVSETITPSPINSWLGEEVKVLGAEAEVTATLGRHRLTLTGALFDADDTAGALLTFRGWALHDLKALPDRKFKLPPIPEQFEYYQPPYTHPLKEMDGGLFKRVGGYAKLGWQGPWPVRVELAHYDNGGNPDVFNDFAEWGWRTRFDHLGVVAEPAAGWRLTGQAIRGRSRMGLVEASGRWIDTGFKSAFLLATRTIGSGSVSARIEGFSTDSDGSLINDGNSERGWAMTLAARKTLTANATVLVEALHVSSRREEREDSGLSPRQRQTQLQASLRLRW